MDTFELFQKPMGRKKDACVDSQKSNEVGLCALRIL